MNIALIYDEDRKRGLNRAKEFRKYLKATNEYLYEATQKRYLLTLALHFLGVDYEKLNKIMRR